MFVEWGRFSHAAVLVFRGFRNFVRNSNQGRSNTFMDFHQVRATSFSCGSIAFVYPNGWILACERIGSVFSKNRSGSSTFIPENSSSEVHTVRRSSYGMSTKYSKVFVRLMLVKGTEYDWIILLIVSSTG